MNSVEKLLSKYAVDIEVENTDTIEDLIQAIIKANDNLKKSNENSNWEMIGKDMNKLQELILKLETLTKEKEKEKEQENDKNNNVVNNTIENNQTIENNSIE